MSPGNEHRGGLRFTYRTDEALVLVAVSWGKKYSLPGIMFFHNIFYCIHSRLLAPIIENK